MSTEITIKAEKSKGEISMYRSDGLLSIHAHEFLHDPKFIRAHARGLRASGNDLGPWRTHVALWCARMALRLPGNFVECGVNKGFMSSAIMEHVDWNSRARHFYLFDKFEAPYNTDIGAVRANFAEWDRVHIVVGSIPESFYGILRQRTAFLHIDMNAPEPEVAALTYFWDDLVPSAVVLLDDYAYQGYGAQKRAMDEFAKAHDTAILSLPTGQGLLLR